MIGQTISHYRVIDTLGAGSMGIVYKAQDLKLDRIVALKFLPSDLILDQESRSRFIKEARAASVLDHANICTIHEIAEENGQLFVVMGYYEGETLNARIARSFSSGGDAAASGMSMDVILDLGIQIGRGLAKVHEQGIVHRNIKPANVIVTADGVAKILDVGLARIEGATMLTRSRMSAGTAAFLSPEQTRGEAVDARSDIWSFGVMMYEMVTGQLPFRGDYAEALVYSILNEHPVDVNSLRPEAPAALNQIIARAMAKKPEDRYQKMDELLADLMLVRSGEKSTAAAQAAEESRRKALRNIWIRSGSVAAVVVLLAVALLVVKPSMDERALASNPITIAVVSFRNMTGDSSFSNLEKYIPVILLTRLEQSKYFRVTTWERLEELLRQMGKPSSSLINKDLGIGLCRQGGVRYLVSGSFTRAGETFVADATVFDVTTLKALTHRTSTGRGVESLVSSQIDEIGREIAHCLLPSRLADQADAPVASLTTDSIEALTDYMKGWEDVIHSRPTEALECFLRAVKRDTNFALGYYGLSLALNRQGDASAGVLALSKAHSLESKLPAKERLCVAALYADVVEHDQDKSAQLYQELRRRYPLEKTDEKK